MSISIGDYRQYRLFVESCISRNETILESLILPKKTFGDYITYGSATIRAASGEIHLVVIMDNGRAMIWDTLRSIREFYRAYL